MEGAAAHRFPPSWERRRAETLAEQIQRALREGRLAVRAHDVAKEETLPAQTKRRAKKLKVTTHVAARQGTEHVQATEEISGTGVREEGTWRGRGGVARGGEREEAAKWPGEGRAEQTLSHRRSSVSKAR